MFEIMTSSRTPDPMPPIPLICRYPYRVFPSLGLYNILHYGLLWTLTRASYPNTNASQILAFCSVALLDSYPILSKKGFLKIGIATAIKAFSPLRPGGWKDQLLTASLILGIVTTRINIHFFGRTASIDL